MKEIIGMIISAAIIITIIITVFAPFIVLIVKVNENENKKKTKYAKSIERVKYENNNIVYETEGINVNEPTQAYIYDADLPYIRKPILTQNEKNFYYQIKPVCDKYNLLLFPKVRVGDIIEVDLRITRNYTYKNQIYQKHFDFVLCDENLNVKAIIELDDSSHYQSEKAKKSDALKNNITWKVGYTLIRTTINQVNEFEKQLEYYKVIEKPAE